MAMLGMDGTEAASVALTAVVGWI